MTPGRWATLALALLGAAIAAKLAWRAFRDHSSGPPMITLRLETKPLGAEIWLDGFPLGKVTPATLRVDNTLPHEVELRLDNWMKVRRTTPVGQPEATLAFELRAAGRVQVSSDPPGARVAVDGESVGIAPCTVEVAAGEPARVTATLDGYMPVANQVTVASGELIPWMVHLRPAGTLDISSDPSAVMVLVDGQSVGKTPRSVLVEANTRHQIEVVLGKLRASRTAIVEAQATRRVELRIEDAEDLRLRASERAVASRLAALRLRIATLEKARPNQLREALATTRKKELLEEEVDRLELKQQELDGNLGAHRTELEENAGAALGR
jgi:archaellum component FlaG (FlaF/FlaG flagellin family)